MNLPYRLARSYGPQIEPEKTDSMIKIVRAISSPRKPAPSHRSSPFFTFLRKLFETVEIDDFDSFP
jgi:hypothetical protein